MKKKLMKLLLFSMLLAYIGLPSTYDLSNLTDNPSNQISTYGSCDRDDDDGK